MRTRLFSLILQAFGKDETDFKDYMFITELSHNGTLIIDDIEDDSVLRRGKPCIHHIYGTDVAMNAGNALYFLSLLPLLRKETDLPDATKSKIFSGATPRSIRYATRQASVRVLPVPAPATTSSGPSPHAAASRWAGLSSLSHGVILVSLHFNLGSRQS